MSVGHYCNREVSVISGDETVQAAAELMRQHHVGDLVLIQETAERRVPLGIVTDRDLVVEVMAAELTPRELLARDIVTEELLVVRESLPLVEALDLMRSRGVRRVPVVTDTGNLVGILTVDDILGVVAEMLEGMAVLVHRQRNREERRRP